MQAFKLFQGVFLKNLEEAQPEELVKYNYLIKSLQEMRKLTVGDLLPGEDAVLKQFKMVCKKRIADRVAKEVMQPDGMEKLYGSPDTLLAEKVNTM